MSTQKGTAVVEVVVSRPGDVMDNTWGVVTEHRNGLLGVAFPNGWLRFYSPEHLEVVNEEES